MLHFFHFFKKKKINLIFKNDLLFMLNFIKKKLLFNNKKYKNVGSQHYGSLSLIFIT